MLGFRSQFEGPFLASVGLALFVLAAAVALGVRGRADGAANRRQVARLLAFGAGLVIVVATAVPDRWPPVINSGGDLALSIGRGGLSDWRVLLDQPDSLAAVLLVANVLLYVPLGLLALFGWQRPLLVLPTAAALSIVIEVAQWQALGRVGSTDDFLLNMTGAVVGLVLALTVRSATRHPPSR